MLVDERRFLFNLTVMRQHLILLFLVQFFNPCYAQLNYKKVLNQGIKEYKKDQFEPAKKSFLKLYNVGYKDDYAVVTSLGTTYLRLEMPDSGLFYLEIGQRINESDDDAALYSDLALGYWLTNKDDKAINCISKSINLEPRNRTYYLNRGLIYYFMDEFSKSCEDLKMATKLRLNIFSKADFTDDCNNWPSEEMVEKITGLPYWYAKMKNEILK